VGVPLILKEGERVSAKKKGKKDKGSPSSVQEKRNVACNASFASRFTRRETKHPGCEKKGAPLHKGKGTPYP